MNVERKVRGGGLVERKENKYCQSRTEQNAPTVRLGMSIRSEAWSMEVERACRHAGMSILLAVEKVPNIHFAFVGSEGKAILPNSWNYVPQHVAVCSRSSYTGYFTRQFKVT